MPLILRSAIAAAMAFKGIFGHAPGHAQAQANDKDVAQALRAGGLALVVRHGATFADQARSLQF
ncbi:hypothetical protein [Bradyrhizobium sp. McL0616]|uniref:hypothetical protein n=1 Tax=Bradyrhizobium sp. McL0616 TaxID=3415674 RepID=UPI003CF7241A